MPCYGRTHTQENAHTHLKTYLTPGNTHTLTHSTHAHTTGGTDAIVAGVSFHGVIEEVGSFRLEVSAHLIVQCSTQLFMKEQSRSLRTAQLILG